MKYLKPFNESYKDLRTYLLSIGYVGVHTLKFDSGKYKLEVITTDGVDNAYVYAFFGSYIRIREGIKGIKQYEEFIIKLNKFYNKYITEIINLYDNVDDFFLPILDDGLTSSHFLFKVWLDISSDYFGRFTIITDDTNLIKLMSDRILDIGFDIDESKKLGDRYIIEFKIDL